ncbi:lytic polysaccharide monooxygenase, partial [Stipitochalara longipes BDJ]
GTTCARVPTSNSPVTDVGSTAFRCNGRPGIASKCTVAAGQTVTVEMHQQPGDRSCKNEAIGGAHYGPVTVYLSKVADASTADGSAGWFKIFQDGWSSKAGGKVGDDDNWGTKDLNTCCGKMNVKIPSDIPAGDYLLRAEALALHTAAQLDGAQFYMTCYQITVTGGGAASPALVMLPGAYKASDPGIHINIHAAVSAYVVPGPTVYAGGTTKSAGDVCVGAEKSTPGPATPSATGKTPSSHGRRRHA